MSVLGKNTGRVRLILSLTRNYDLSKQQNFYPKVKELTRQPEAEFSSNLEDIGHNFVQIIKIIKYKTRFWQPKIFALHNI